MRRRLKLGDTVLIAPLLPPSRQPHTNQLPTKPLLF